MPCLGCLGCLRCHFSPLRDWHDAILITHTHTHTHTRCLLGAAVPPAPHGWQGRAPHLWPAVGRSYLDSQVEEFEKTGTKPADCRYRNLDGVERGIGVHGFAMSCEWVVVPGSLTADEAAGATVSCALDSRSVPPACTASFDYDYELVVKYTLRDGRLQVAYDIFNRGGEFMEVMPFSVGNHASFNFPFVPGAGAGGGRWSGGLLKGNDKSSYMYALTGLSLLSGQVELVHPDMMGGGGGGTGSAAAEEAEEGKKAPAAAADTAAAAAASTAAVGERGLPLTDPRALDTVLGCDPQAAVEAALAGAAAAVEREAAEAAAIDAAWTKAGGAGLAVSAAAGSAGGDGGEEESKADGGKQQEDDAGPSKHDDDDDDDDGGGGGGGEAAGADAAAEGGAYISLVQPGALTVTLRQEPVKDEESAANLLLATSRHFVLWGEGSDEAGGFLCVEPWLGGPNSLNTGKGRVDLEPGRTHQWSFSCEVEWA